MENLVIRDFWRHKRVLLTGHTGFKGSWMAVLLSQLGARVTGYSLDPESKPNLFSICKIRERLDRHNVADIRDKGQLSAVLSECQPDIIFHMAAQSLVRRSYAEPLETFDTNVMGTATLLEVSRQLESPCAIVIVTTDKVYENAERNYPFRESDPLGAADPYSASKAAAELVAASWRKSFSAADGRNLRIATVRAGNVVGGGDWAKDRLIPDCMRAFKDGTPATIRNPSSVRPWQHVLDPIRGYMMVADRLFSGGSSPDEPVWNFGPAIEGEATAAIVAQKVADLWGGTARLEFSPQVDAPKEAGLLRLDSAKAQLELGWQPVWRLSATIAETVSWYRDWAEGGDMLAFTLDQIDRYLGLMDTIAERDA